MSFRKEVLTTGEVARICQVAARTVSKWVDSGQLPGYRIPGSKDRRIHVNQLIRFMKAHGLPMKGLEVGSNRALLVIGSESIGSLIREALSHKPELAVHATGHMFEAGVLAERLRPFAIVADVEHPGMGLDAFDGVVHKHETLQATLWIALGDSLPSTSNNSPVSPTFAATLRKPLSKEQFLDLLERASSGNSR